jgi:hypothetical protein
MIMKTVLTRKLCWNSQRRGQLVSRSAQYTEIIYVTRGRGQSTYIDALNLAIDARVKQLDLSITTRHNIDDR